MKTRPFPSVKGLIIYFSLKPFSSVVGGLQKLRIAIFNPLSAVFEYQPSVFQPVATGSFLRVALNLPQCLHSSHLLSASKTFQVC
jgi:hypothetical protein